ncbi:hypothetical protein [Oceanicoccus sp. KOV_DT_Chl]|uniref:hypothetical protein n=1 Tax=Oceanicoccus sp. KOV_DT_Chl TaxID=1904639 RepID=UPI000C7DEC87|nr:hypothetical protein [Oceanicoccus sp. KOV_DT_Chl]
MPSRFILWVVLLLISTLVYSEWLPPKEPDLQVILTEASEDKSNKQYQLSLEKYIWFHNNALKIDRSFYGVRLSFALMGWVELANVYEPAKLSLLEHADQAERSVKNSSSCCRDEFNDFASINDVLGLSGRTVELFKWLEANDPLKAEQAFSLARAALVKSNEYLLMGKYIKPRADFEKSVAMYRNTIEVAKTMPQEASMLEETAQYSYINQTTTLVAILAINGRTDEALKVANESKQVFSSDAFNVELEKALSGKVPQPWPSLN